jgi:hypothetical protein
MPAGLPGSTAVQNAANPALGRFVIFDPLSGPKGSPFDKDNTGNASTGALSTGIGFGDADILGFPGVSATTAPVAIQNAGFSDNNIPGEENTTYAAGGPPPVVASSTIKSTMMYIGGGRSIIAGGVAGGLSTPSPYTAGVALCGAGNGGSRDGGAGPAFTGFPMKMVTVPAGTPTVAVGAVVETGWVNRADRTMLANESAYGSATAALAAAS